MGGLKTKICNSIFKLVYLGIALNIFVVSYVDAKKKVCDDTLQMVHIIIRHGNRTTVSSMIYPSDPHINETYYPYGKDELTLIGKTNAYEVGLDIRERYDRILSEVYYPPEVESYCSNYSRTQMTLQSLLTAMYPPVWPNIVRPYLMWQPISYQTLPTATDNLIDVFCPNINNYTTKKDPELQELYDYVSQYAGKRIVNSNDIMNVYDTILVEDQNGIPVPDWALEIFYNGKLLNAGLTQWTDYIHNHLNAFVGPLIKKITDDSVRRIKNETPNNIVIYSGHDTNIAMLLGLFEAYSPENKFEIEYLSHIFIELHKIRNVYGFKVFFQNGPGYPLTQLKFRSCTEDFCPMNKFIESTKFVYSPLTTCR